MTTSTRTSNPGDHRFDQARLFEQFASVDVGEPQIAGSARLVESGWDLIGGGVDIWEATDEFQFVFKVFEDDFDLAVRVESFSPAHLYSKTGLMVRESLDADSAHLMFVLFADDQPRNNNLGAYEMQFRAHAGHACRAIYPAVRPPATPEFPAAYPNCWLRVTRLGDQFSAFASTDGKSWRLYAEQELPLAKHVKVGPALTSHNPQAEATAAFRDYIEYS